MSLPKCYFNYDTLIARIGNIYKGYQDLQCIQVPPFKKVIREAYGKGGWIEGHREVEKTFDKCFIIIKDTKPIGVLIEPYHQSVGIKSDIYPLDYPFNYFEIKEFINQLK